MRNDDENVRQHLPVLKRIFILTAVLTAIPVAMWTVTAFVRIHLAGPRLPTAQEMSAAAVNLDSPQAAAVPADRLPAAMALAAKKEARPIVEARATASDVADPPVRDPAAATPQPPAAVPAPTASSGPAADGNPFPPAPAMAQSGATAVPAAAAVPASPWPDPANSNPSAQAAQPQPAAEPATPPIAGPIPLPRKRPKIVRIAQAGSIPLPRPRPEAAGPTEPEHINTPLDFFRNIFQRGSSGPETAPAYSPEADH